MSAVHKSASHFSFFSSYLRYGPELNTHDVIKCIAILAMVIDHIGYFFFPDQAWWRVAGRVAAPIFFFLIGFSPSKRLHKELLLFGFLMVGADIAMSQPIFPLNILFSILFCQLFVQLFEKTDPEYLGYFFLLIMALTLHIPGTFVIEYGAHGLMFAIAGYYYRHHPERMLTALALIIAVFTYLIGMAAGFNFNKAQNFIMLIEMVALAAVLKSFRHETVSVPGNLSLFAKAAMFIGRNSLYFYVGHYLLFETINYLMKAPVTFSIRYFP